MMERIKKEIEQALHLMDVCGAITLDSSDRFTAKIYVDGKYFGLWDVIKKTFVE